MAKKPLNITLGENTIKGLKEEAERLEISVSSFITMLYKNYEREKLTLEMMKQKELFSDMQQILKSELERQDVGTWQKQNLSKNSMTSEK